GSTATPTPCGGASPSALRAGTGRSWPTGPPTPPGWTSPRPRASTWCSTTAARPPPRCPSRCAPWRRGSLPGATRSTTKGPTVFFLLLLWNLLPLPAAMLSDTAPAVTPVFAEPYADTEIVGLVARPDCTDIDASVSPAYFTDIGGWNAAVGGGWVFNPG